MQKPLWWIKYLEYLKVFPHCWHSYFRPVMWVSTCLLMVALWLICFWQIVHVNIWPSFITTSWNFASISACWDSGVSQLVWLLYSCLGNNAPYLGPLIFKNNKRNIIWIFCGIWYSSHMSDEYWNRKVRLNGYDQIQN